MTIPSSIEPVEVPEKEALYRERAHARVQMNLLPKKIDDARYAVKEMELVLERATANHAALTDQINQFHGGKWKSEVIPGASS